ncbi:MAG: hypothetical protein EVG15_04845 [Candidatus Acididesulfobacter diazotrophicus]|jgi:hypothetical protein|uniref:DUF3373 family protein n=1 Tax=Candidatus Acididesulfobacter diazotrophicus TaxID=2597226 RepID=A0A519BN53_9DELT|nr:MAG: hypothetical protein EVG15_04845 [Candidatus Acididesulfobacter diazotrophicus]
MERFCSFQKRKREMHKGLAIVVVLAAALAFVFTGGAAKMSYAAGQSSVSSNNGGSVSLYENSATGEIFLKPGTGRVKVSKNVIRKLLSTAETQSKTQEKIQQLQNNEHLLEKQVKNVKTVGFPAWTKHITLGTLIYMGYGYYNNTGFTSALQLEENPGGPGNNGYNAFNVNRAYLIFQYHQDDWFLKITPNIYKSNNSGGSASSSGFNFGNEYFRLKYAFLQFNHVLDSNGFTVNVKAGQFPTPMIAWEDGLLGYHVAERTPWGFLGVTSTQAGLGISGKFRADGNIYMAYNAGYFDNATFHQGENVDQKSPQVRISFYPMGTDSNLDGLGVSGYYAWSEQTNNFDGNGNVENNFPTARASAILDYKTPQWLIALQYDYGLNVTSGGFASGAGSISQDAGSWCGYSSSANHAYACNAAGATYPFNISPVLLGITDANGIIGHNVEHGADAFGYYNVPNSKFGVFGLIQRFYYETPSSSLGLNMPYGNPFDFQRTVLGVAYHLNSHITLTLDNQNYQFLHEKNYMNAQHGSDPSAYYTYGQWMGDTNAIFVQARIAF